MVLPASLLLAVAPASVVVVVVVVIRGAGLGLVSMGCWYKRERGVCWGTERDGEERGRASCGCVGESEVGMVVEEDVLGGEGRWSNIKGERVNSGVQRAGTALQE
jgi:hypothetical protein